MFGTHFLVRIARKLVATFLTAWNEFIQMYIFWRAAFVSKNL